MSGFCNQRKLFMTYNNPTSRAEIEQPPDGFSTSQLNMRRKSEILQYKNNQTNNQFSKKSDFARRVNGRYNRNRVCNNTTKVVNTSTSYTDVPGSSILIHDPSVPIWKYNTTNINRYSSTDGLTYEEEEKEWIFYPIIDFIIIKNKRAGILTIYNDIKLNSYTYSFSTPIVSRFVGQNMNITSAGAICSNKIVYISLTIFYNEDVIFSSTKDIAPSINEHSFTIDHPESTTDNLFNFEYYFYNGLITFDNIVLPTSPGFNYEFKFDIFTILNINTDNSIEKDNNIIKNSIVSSTIANVSNIFDDYSQNVTGTTPISNDSNFINITAI